MPADKPFAAITGGMRLAVRLTPRASRDGVDGVAHDAAGRPVLRVRVTAPPVDGAANEALLAFLAKSLGLRQADVILRAGMTSRIKTVEIVGGDGLTQRIEAWISGASAARRPER